MKVRIRDIEALNAISPVALSSYARDEGWEKAEEYGKHADVYVADGRPEIVVPRTAHLGDYAETVSELIAIFAEAAGRDELAMYRDLVTADRDVIRVRATESEDGSVSVNDGVGFVEGARDMVRAAACSVRDPRPVYRAGANREAAEYLERVRLGQTEQGSFAVTLLTPVVPPPTRQPQPALDPALDSGPFERRVTDRLAEALEAARQATERTNAGETGAFSEAVASGVNANLCEALVQMIGPFPTLDIGLVWARTRPQPRFSVPFPGSDAPLLREAARTFRDREPRMDMRLFGFVQRLKRDESETEGTITLRASIEGNTESVTTVLGQRDYETAVGAHKAREPVIAEGDLERVGQRWHLKNPRITEVIQREAGDED